jgi:hypothetical protein
MGQTYSNLEYVLNHEENFPSTTKLFVVNRILDSSEEQRILNLLHSHPEVKVVTRPMNWAELPADESQWMGYVTNVNVARNEALTHAFSEGGEWVMMNDGNTFVTRPMFDSIVEAGKDPSVKYVSTPHVRVIEEQNESWLSTSTTRDEMMEGHHLATEKQEGALSFKRDAPEWFDPNKVYGDRDKWDLVLSRCGAGMPDEVATPPEGCAITHEAAIRLWSYPATEDARRAIEDVNVRGPTRKLSAENMVNTIRDLKAFHAANL